MMPMFEKYWQGLQHLKARDKELLAEKVSGSTEIKHIRSQKPLAT